MADLLRAHCRCRCHNPCGYGTCLNKWLWNLPNPQCANACLTPQKFYVRFEGIIFSAACHGCVRQVPEGFESFYPACSGVTAQNLSFPGRPQFDGAYELTHYSGDTYWNGNLSGYAQDTPDWTGRVDIRTTLRRGFWWWELVNEEYVQEWRQEYGELTAQCQPGDYGAAGGCSGTGYLTPTGADSGSTRPWMLRLNRTEAGWELSLEATLHAVMPGVCASEGVKLIAFRGAVADPDHSTCYRPLVFSNALTIGHTCSQPDPVTLQYAPMEVYLGQGGQAIVTPCAPEVGL